MRRVAVTGMGIVSCIGNGLDEVASALRGGVPGIGPASEFAAAGLRSRVAGIPSLEALPTVKRTLRRFMSDPALYAYHAACGALADAKLPAELLGSARTGLIVGSGASSGIELVETVTLAREHGAHNVAPYAVARVMSNTASANLVTAFGIRGTSYSLVSACATSAHCIGHGAELIQLGKLDRVIVGGSEEVRWTTALVFDAMGALSRGFNDTPQWASRPYDKRRDGFVLAGGAGVLVLEELESALARGARVRAELVGYGTSSDGANMVTPRAEGIARAMNMALEEAKTNDVDYINTHATSTQVGDRTELEAIRQVFGERPPLISSTKGLTGHAIGASGAHEAIFCLLMMERGFVAACANLFEPDPETRGLPLVTAAREASLETVLTNSLGFGSTNASLVFRRWHAKSG